MIFLTLSIHDATIEIVFGLTRIKLDGLGEIPDGQAELFEFGLRYPAIGVRVCIFGVHPDGLGVCPHCGAGVSHLLIHIPLP